jgi:lipopolysaccharide/colanic/teichoic acid biosynthesis glycosyltransferase
VSRSSVWLRAVDLACALVLLPIWLPLLLMSMVAVALFEGRPIFYRARRMGLDGGLFSMLKIRSMSRDAERRGPAVSSGGDRRVTPVGRMLRRTKLDELPQFLHVLMGEMSIVGPRPESPAYLPNYTEAGHRSLRVKPGVTGPGAIYFFFNDAAIPETAFEDHYLRVLLPTKLVLDDACAADLIGAPVRTTLRFSLWTLLAIANKTLNRPCPNVVQRYFEKIGCSSEKARRTAHPGAGHCADSVGPGR